MVSSSCEGKEMDCKEIEVSVREHEEWELEEFTEFCENMEEAQKNSSIGQPVVDKSVALQILTFNIFGIHHGTSTRDFCLEKGFELSHLRILFTLVLTLAYAAFVRTFLRITKLSIPYTVVIFLTGNLVGIVSRLVGSGFRSYTEIARISPQIYLFVFLPVLVFESAFSLNPHVFFRASAQIITLAFPGMVLATFIAAYLSQVILSSYNWTFAEAFWFGSIASATDPVAVVAILRELGASEVLGILIEGESLLNDGVAVLMFDILEELLTCQIKINLWLYVLGKFFQITLGGPTFGFVMGKIAVICLSNVFNHSTIEITITVAAAYLTYYISEDILGVSGILAVVVVGLTIGSQRTCISPEVDESMHHFWEMIGFLANSVVFMIIGIIVTETGLNYVEPQDWIYLIYLYLVQNGIRLIMLILLYPFLDRLGYGMSWRNMIVMVWGGLRGAVGTCLALEVYDNEHLCQHLNLGPKFLFQTAGNVFLTLLINALTTKPLLKFLKLIEVSPGAMADMYNGLKKIKHAQSRAINALKSSNHTLGANWTYVQEYTNIKNPYKKVEVKKTGVTGDGHDNGPGTIQNYSSSADRDLLMDETKNQILRTLKASFWRQFEQGQLIETAVLKLVKLAEAAQAKPLKLIYTADVNQYWTLDDGGYGFKPSQFSCMLMKLMPCINRKLDAKLNCKLFSGYEIGKGFIFALSDAIKYLPSIAKDTKIFAKINRVLVDERTTARNSIGILQKNHPELATAVKTRHASRAVLNQMQYTLENLKNDGLVDEPDCYKLVHEIERKMKLLLQMPKSIPPYPPETTLKNVSWIKGSSESSDFLLDHAELLTFTFGDTIYAWNELPNGIYIIIFGMVKIEYIPTEDIKYAAKCGELPNSELIIDNTFCSRGYDFFYTGTVLGEKGLLTGQRRAAAVTCETTVQTYHIPASIMQSCLTKFRCLEERLWRAVGMRLAYAILPLYPKYSDWETDKIQDYIENCSVPVDNSFDTMWIEKSVADILVIQGMVKDALSGETFTAPQLVPRRVSKIILIHTPKLKTRILIILSCQEGTDTTTNQSNMEHEDKYF